jgi:hypothetical protein
MLAHLFLFMLLLLSTYERVVNSYQRFELIASEQDSRPLTGGRKMFSLRRPMPERTRGSMIRRRWANVAADFGITAAKGNDSRSPSEPSYRLSSPQKGKSRDPRGGQQ